MPRSSARWRARTLSSSRAPIHCMPPIPHAPKPISETRSSVLPSGRCFMGDGLSHFDRKPGAAWPESCHASRLHAAARHTRSRNEALTGDGTLASSLLNTEIAGGRGQAALADCHGPPGADDGGGGPLAAALGWSRAGGSRVSCATPGCLFGSLLPPSHLIVAVVVVGRPRYHVTATPRSRRGSVSLARKLTTSRRAGRLLTT